MIQHEIGQQLIDQYAGYECHHQNKEENTKVAVLVETRDAYFLPFVIKNFCHLLGDEWNFHLFINQRVQDFLTRQLPHFRYRTTLLPQQRMNAMEYSAILRQKAFWQSIQEETILIFQTDTILLQPVPDWPLGYAMIGAPCGFINDDRCIFNGGFSIRSKQAMVEVGLEHEKNVRESRPEDVFFTEELWKKGGYKLPGVMTAFQFASESTQHKHCVGIHGTDKYY